MTRYADICVNLENAQFAQDREAVIQRALAVGVDKIVITGTDVASSQAALEYHHRGFLFSTAGVHPHDAALTESNWLAQLEALLQHPQVVAVGETGLDFNRNYSPPALQIECFRQQIKLAAQYGKPLFVHDRDSDGTVLRMLEEFAEALPPVVVHCFTGSQIELENYLSAGFLIGITGWITEKKRGVELRSMVADIPLDQLLVETDAPFLKPQNIPTKVAKARSPDISKRRNEPAYLPYVVQQIAAVREESATEIAQATRANAIRFFNLN